MRESKVVIKDVLINDKDCYDELWEHMEDLVYSIAYTHARSKKVSLDDVKQNSYIAWYNLTNSFSTDKMMGDSLEGNYVNYLHKYLPKRMYDYLNGSYSMFNDYRVRSLDTYDNYEFMSEEFVIDNRELVNMRATIDLIVDNFTDSRREVFELMRQGYNKTDISRILDVNRSTVYHHYYKIMDIFEEKLK
jgi:DNA-directed RNA polymerase specialized sigma24 family protein